MMGVRLQHGQNYSRQGIDCAEVPMSFGGALMKRSFIEQLCTHRASANLNTTHSRVYVSEMSGILKLRFPGSVSRMKSMAQRSFGAVAFTGVTLATEILFLRRCRTARH